MFTGTRRIGTRRIKRRRGRRRRARESKLNREEKVSRDRCRCTCVVTIALHRRGRDAYEVILSRWPQTSCRHLAFSRKPRGGGGRPANKRRNGHAGKRDGGGGPERKTFCSWTQSIFRGCSTLTFPRSSMI